MIYVSSSCVKANTIGEAIKTLVKEGFKNIELSGGGRPYEGIETDLLRLKDQYNLNLLCHNYFPPPKKDFVLNLSAAGKTGDLSFEHAARAIQLSKKLGARKIAFHAGFLIDIPLDEIGKSIKKQQLVDRGIAVNRFRERIIDLRAMGGEDLQLYVENNVVSTVNFKNFDGTNPFLFTDLNGWKALKIQGVKPLMDVAHLKVSCNTLNLSFESELNALVQETDYVHISDNDGLTDSNEGLKTGGRLFHQLNKLNLAGKTITLEVYSGMKELKESYKAVQQLVYG